MALIDINLLAQQQNRLQRLGQANVVVSIVTGAIVGLQLLVLVFLLSTYAVRSASHDSLVKERDELQREVVELDQKTISPYRDITLTQQLKTFQKQLEGSRQLVDNHKYFSLYISEIAINTPTSIVFDSFNIEGVNKLTATGRATSYNEVSKLVENFNKLTFAKGTQLQSAKLDPEQIGGAGRYPVQFSMSIELKSAADLNKLPSPTRAGGPTPIPTVRPTGSPSPGVVTP